MTDLPESGGGWPGARNLRDLGGLPCSDGGTTRHRRVWRSATPEWMSEAGWAAARAMGLHTVVDLRWGDEIGRRAEHPEVDEVSVRAGIRIVQAPTEDPTDPVFLDRCGPWLDHPCSYGPNIELYPERFAAVFCSIADSEGGVLVHCQGGRDRTGMVMAMLLSLSGVTGEAILGDYEAAFRGASDDGYGKAFDPSTGEWREGQPLPRDPNEVDAAVADRLPVLAGWIRGLDVAAYLRTAGVSTGRIDRLRSLLR